MPHPYQLSATQAAQAIRSGELSAEALVRSCLERITAQEPTVRAWESLDAEGAIAAARQLDAQAPRGPLHGVPVGIKDVIDTRDLPTRHHSPLYRDHRPSADADVVLRARQAGLILLGKTTTQEFATRGELPPTRNPHSPAHTPGGSSGGSAAAVASLMVPLAISTQTAGSIVRPASYCGIVGFKPSFGAIGMAGVKSLVPSCDTLGIHARSVGDAALALAVLSDRGGIDESAPEPQAALRIGIWRGPHWALAEPASRWAMQTATQRLQQAGFSLPDMHVPAAFEALADAHDTISDYEARRALADEWLHRRDGLSAGVRAKLQRGETIAEAAYRRALDVAQQCRAACADIFEHCDCLITPSTPGTAPLFDAQDTGSAVFNKLWTTLGLPCISVPMPWFAPDALPSREPAPAPLPIGIQLVAPHGCDALLLHAAERALQALNPSGAATHPGH